VSTRGRRATIGRRTAGNQQSGPSRGWATRPRPLVANSVTTSGRQGCHNRRFWIKMTVRTSISSVRPFSSSERPHPPVFTSPGTVLPADRSLPHPRVVKFHLCGRKPRPHKRRAHRRRRGTRPHERVTASTRTLIRTDAEKIFFIFLFYFLVRADAEIYLFLFLFLFFLHPRGRTSTLMFFLGGWKCKWKFDVGCGRKRFLDQICNPI
jgi:hypothetical protein